MNIHYSTFFLRRLVINSEEFQWTIAYLGVGSRQLRGAWSSGPPSTGRAEWQRDCVLTVWTSWYRTLFLVLHEDHSVLGIVVDLVAAMHIKWGPVNVRGTGFCNSVSRDSRC